MLKRKTASPEHLRMLQGFSLLKGRWINRPTIYPARYVPSSTIH